MSHKIVVGSVELDTVQVGALAGAVALSFGLGALAWKMFGETAGLKNAYFVKDLPSSGRVWARLYELEKPVVDQNNKRHHHVVVSHSMEPITGRDGETLVFSSDATGSTRPKRKGKELVFAQELAGIRDARASDDEVLMRLGLKGVGR